MELAEVLKRFEFLTMKEKEVFKDMCEQLSHEEIAVKRNCAFRTAKYHVSNIYRKMGVRGDSTVRSRRLQFNKMFLTFKLKDGLEL
jgi:DNA-binding NarL/FixJ family response regulator